MRGTENEKAFRACVKATDLARQPWHPGELKKSDQNFRRAIRLDTGVSFESARKKRIGYPRAWSRLGYIIVAQTTEQWIPRDQVDKRLEDAREFLELAVELDPYDYDLHWNLSFYYRCTERFSQADKSMRRALALNDDNDNLCVEWAEMRSYSGHHDEALKIARRFMRSEDWHRWEFAWIAYHHGTTVGRSKARMRRVLALYDEALECLDGMYWQPRETAWRGGKSKREDDRGFIFHSLLTRALLQIRRSQFLAALDLGGSKAAELAAKKAYETFQNRRRAWSGRMWTQEDERSCIERGDGTRHPFYNCSKSCAYLLEACTLLGMPSGQG